MGGTGLGSGPWPGEGSDPGVGAGAGNGNGPEAVGGAETGPETGPETGAETGLETGDGSGATGRLGQTLSRFAWEIGFIALAALVLSFVLKTFLVQSFFIPSKSMMDTLLIDDRVMVSKLVPQPFGVHRGDVVVFTDPGGWLTGPNLPSQTGVAAWLHGALEALGLAPSTANNFVIKRVIGVGGDRIQCVVGAEDINQNGVLDGAVQVNGVVLEESAYLGPGEIPCEAEFDTTVPDGALWLMGDNRDESGDSRFHQEAPGGGSVSLDHVVGVAKVRTWPLDRIAILRNPGAVFADVPDPDSAAAAEGR